MRRLNKLDVFCHDRHVGTMALYQNRQAAFEYSDDWIADGFSISPFSLPLEKRVFMPKIDPFDGIFGVFADSLPDGWGRLLVDRLMKRNGINPMEIGNLDRLAIVGETGMGALSYKPVITLEEAENDMSLDELAAECEKILQTEYSDKLDTLFRLGGSSGGTRPKILTKIDNDDWIIKFPASYDSKNIGKQEYDYALCAGKCGIDMAPVRLFKSNECQGYFGTKRFDRINTGDGNNVVSRHMVSVSGLLETSHRIPNLDYELLMRLTMILTKDTTECKKLYRLMCFNVFAHNRDDHSKNFSYIYLEDEKRWVLSPAYDLTYSSSLNGEHATTINGNGVNPGIDDLLEVAKKAGLDIKAARTAAEDIRECVKENLKEYLYVCYDY